jgi:hypothetical protein
MSRELKQKKLDNSLKFSDDFDEQMLDIIEKKDFGSSTGQEVEPSAADGGADEIPSLDPDDLSEGSVPDLGEDKVETGTGEEVASPEKEFSIWGLNRKKLIIIGSTATCVLAILATIATFHFRGRANLPLPGATIIRKPIVIPHEQRKATFFVYVDNGQRKDILQLAMNLEYYGVTPPESSGKAETVFRDTVYQYLISHKPPENSYRYWEQMVQKDLYKHLKERFPKCGLRSIRIENYSRM